MPKKVFSLWLAILIILAVSLTIVYASLYSFNVDKKIWIIGAHRLGPFSLNSKETLEKVLVKAGYNNKENSPLLIVLVQKGFPWEEPGKKTMFWQFPNHASRTIGAAGCTTPKEYLGGKVLVMKLAVAPDNYFKYVSSQEANQKFNNLATACLVKFINHDTSDARDITSEIIKTIDVERMFVLQK